MRRTPYMPGVVIAAAAEFRAAEARRPRFGSAAYMQAKMDEATVRAEARRSYRTAIARLDALDTADKSADFLADLLSPAV